MLALIVWSKVSALLSEYFLDLFLLIQLDKLVAKLNNVEGRMKFIIINEEHCQSDITFCAWLKQLLTPLFKGWFVLFGVHWHFNVCFDCFKDVGLEVDFFKKPICLVLLNLWVIFKMSVFIYFENHTNHGKIDFLGIWEIFV